MYLLLFLGFLVLGGRVPRRRLFSGNRHPRTKGVLRDVPSVDQLISMTNSSVTSVLAPSPPNLSPDIDKPPNIEGVAAESIRGERPFFWFAVVVVVAVLALTMHRLVLSDR